MPNCYRVAVLVGSCEFVSVSAWNLGWSRVVLDACQLFASSGGRVEEGGGMGFEFEGSASGLTGCRGVTRCF